MSWSCGIVGLPNVGKSSLFKALTAHDVTIENYPFSTIDPNRAVVPLEDATLMALADLSNAEKTSPAALKVVDVAGLVAGASKGDGLGNTFLGHLRDVDLLIHVIAVFAGDSSELVPSESKAIIDLELQLADLEVINRRKEKVLPRLRSKEAGSQKEITLLERWEAHLDQGLPLHDLHQGREDGAQMKGLPLLTSKPVVYVCNHAESLLPDYQCSFLKEPEPLVHMSARLEAEVSELPEEERATFLGEYGLTHSRCRDLLLVCSEKLNLVSFYTIKGREARAWVVPAGLTAQEAAGRIHSTMQEGFISAEVIQADDLLRLGSARARAEGYFRQEGRSYLVRQGDVLQFRFRERAGR